MDKAKGLQWVIYSKSESDIQDEAMYWSNEIGWCSIDEASTYTTAQKACQNYLPLDGEWRIK